MTTGLTALLAGLSPLANAASEATVLEYAGDQLVALNGVGPSDPTPGLTTSERRTDPRSHRDWRDAAHAAARRYRIPPKLFLRLIHQESRWQTEALSPRGAYGLAQLMPATARQLGVDRRDPLQNLDGGARYLAAQYARFGTWPLALAAYNAGPEAVARHGGIPPYAETQSYVRAIIGSEGARAAPQSPTAVRRPGRGSVMEFLENATETQDAPYL